MKSRLFIFLLLLPVASFSQSSKLSFGVEQDILPYATGGYFAGAWLGKDHVRLRAVTALVNKPDFLTKSPFEKNKIRAYALVADYFLKQDWKGWYAGSGLVLWNGSIRREGIEAESNYRNLLLNGTIGYNLPLTKHFYISPWAGMHIKLAGDSRVDVGDKQFKPALLNPEASVKIGLRL